MAEFFELVTRLQSNIDSLDVILSGDEDATALINGQSKSSIRKAINDSFAEIRAMVQGRLAFETVAQMYADLNHPANTLAEVWNDAPNNIGLYAKIGIAGNGSWQKSPYDVVEITNSNIDAAEQRINESVANITQTQQTQLNEEVENRKAILDSYPLVDVAYAIADEAGNAVLTIDHQGRVHIHRELSTANIIQQVVYTEEGTVYAITDDHGNVAFEIRDTGAVRLGYTEFENSKLMSDNSIVHAWCDELGNMVLYVDKTGSVVIPNLKINAPETLTNKVTLSNSETIVLVGDSYTASHYTQKDKAYISILSMLTDYRLQNFAVSGNDSLDMTYRIVNDLSYVDGQKFSDMNATYAFLLSHTNDGQFRSANLSYYKDNIERLIYAVKAAGTMPILCSEFSGTTVDNQLLASLASKHQIPFVDNTVVNYEIGGLVRGPFHQGHPGTRTNGVFWLPLFEHLNKMPMPKQGIKVFRNRAAVQNIEDLLYDDVYQRAKLFKELSITHYHLSDATKQHFEELDGDDVYNHVCTTDEYLQLQNGNEVAFSHCALIEIILPGTSNTITSATIDLVLSSGCQVYIKDMNDVAAGVPGRVQGATPILPEYLDKYQTPKGAWKLVELGLNGKIELSSDDLYTYLNYDKLQILVVNSNGFTLNNVSAEYLGSADKADKHVLESAHHLGPELLSQNYCGSQQELADWVLTGNPEIILPIDNYNSPRGASLNAPVSGVTVINSVDKLMQTASLQPDPLSEKNYKLLVWCRNFPKAFLDNSVYQLNAVQVVDSSQPGNTYDQVSPVTSDSFDLKSIQLEYFIDGVDNVNSITTMTDFTGLMWRRVEFDIRLPRATMSQNANYAFRLSGLDGDIQIAKVQLREVK